MAVQLEDVNLVGASTVASCTALSAALTATMAACILLLGDAVAATKAILS